MSEQKIPIPAMLYNAAVGGHVTNSQQIIDENLNREQNDINQETVGAVPYNSTTPNGMGRIVLKKTDNFKEVVEAQTNGNTIFVIKYDFTLTDDVTIPANCILQFDGGSISGAYTITGQNTGIDANDVKILDTSVTLDGIWNGRFNVVWYGASASKDITLFIDDTVAIQKSLDNPFNIIYFPIGYYYITSTVTLSLKTKNIILEGDSNMAFGEMFNLDGLNSRSSISQRAIKGAVLYTDLDIDLFKFCLNQWSVDTCKGYETNPFVFKGGKLDVSLCDNYTHSAFTFCLGQFGASYSKIDTTIAGKKNTWTSAPANYDNVSVGFRFKENDNTNINNQFAFWQNWNLSIFGFDIGFYCKFNNGISTTTMLDGIINCSNVAIKCDSSCFSGGYIKTSIQPTSQAVVPLLQGNFGYAPLYSYIWDIANQEILLDETASFSLNILNKQDKYWLIGDYSRHINPMLVGGISNNNNTPLSFRRYKLRGNGNNPRGFFSYMEKSMNDLYGVDVIDDVTITTTTENVSITSTEGPSLFTTGLRYYFDGKASNAKFTITINTSNSRLFGYSTLHALLIRLTSIKTYCWWKKVSVKFVDRSNVEHVIVDSQEISPERRSVINPAYDNIIAWQTSGIGNNWNLNSIIIEFEDNSESEANVPYLFYDICLEGILMTPSNWFGDIVAGLGKAKYWDGTAWVNITGTQV